MRALRTLIVPALLAAAAHPFGCAEAASAGPSAPPAAPSPAVPDAVRAVFAKRFPGVQFDSYRPAPMPGFYEVTIGIEVYFVSADGRYVVRDTVYDLERNQDLREQRQAEIRRELIGAVPESQQIVFKPAGVPKHAVTVFTDIDCGYCRKLHASIGEYLKLGIEVRYVFFPRTGLGSESWQKAQDVWCAKDRKRALTVAKLGQALPHLKCDAGAVAAGYRLGEKLRLDGTPMIINSDGYQIGGYLTPEQMSAKLDALAALVKARG